MQALGTDKLVSIVIPCYNGAHYILDTLASILSQDYSNFEIFLIDDGSTDNSASIVKGINDKRINYIYQKNTGVSKARNNGLKLAKGTLIIFFDSDDLMSEGFISSRIIALSESGINFVAGNILHYNGSKTVNNNCYFPRKNTFQSDILLFKNNINTCPSNTMFITSFLLKNNIIFNEKLSSTADRYFLLNCAKYGIGHYIETVSPLIYRVSENSMSHQLSENLIIDNEHYYTELKANNLIPADLAIAFNIKMLRILSGANFNIKKFEKSLKFGLQYFYWKAKSYFS